MEHAVLVSFRYRRDNLDALFALEDQLESAIGQAGVGEFDRDDADTTAAVTGQIAGAFYGVNAIPANRLDSVSMRDVIEAYGVRFCEPRAA